MVKKLTITLLSIILMAGMTTVLAHGYETVNCKIFGYSPHALDGYYLVDFICKENLEELFHSRTGTESPYSSKNWVNKNKFSQDLIDGALMSQKYLRVVIRGTFFSTAQTIDGIDVS